MKIQIRFFIASLILMSLVAAQSEAVQTHRFSQAAISPTLATSLVGRWHVKFALSGGGEKNLIFDSKAKGFGSFLLLDTGPDDKAVADPLPAVWSELTKNRVSFSGEAELPIGSCCREIGTLMFKGKFETNSSISGKLIFVTSVDDEESAYKFRSAIGTFAATRMRDRR
jgi:hypothetical protein